MPEATAGEPLSGCRVAVTRPAEGAAEFAALLRRYGAVPMVIPLVALEPAADPAPLAGAVRQLSSYDWIVFTSPTAVRFLHEELARSDPAGRMAPAAGRQRVAAAAARQRIAAVGPATARAVAERLGWAVDVLPGEYAGDALTAAMAEVAPVRGARVLWPRAEAAREALPRDLRAAGAVLDAPITYRTTLRRQAARELVRLLGARAVDILTFTSPSAVHSLAAARSPADDVASGSAGGPVIAVIGPSTAAAARQNGMTVHVEPQQHTIPALVEALRDYLRARAMDAERDEDA